MTTKILYKEEDLDNNDLFNVNSIETKYGIKSNHNKISEFINKIDTDEIKNICCFFMCNNNLKISLLKNLGIIECILNDFNAINYQILNNLPYYLSTLTMIKPPIFDYNFYNSLKNLPITLTTINIRYNENYKKIILYEAVGSFNILFELKIPFGCKVNLFFDEIVKYNVIYENNNNDELTIENNKTKKKHIIRKINKLELKPSVDIDNNYLTAEERRRFAQVGREYLLDGYIPDDF